MSDADRYMLGLLVFLVTMFVAQRMSSNAMKRLPDEKKAQLIDLFSGNRIIHYILIIVIVFGNYMFVRATGINTLLSNFVYLVVLLGYIMFINFQSYRKLKKNNFPDDYIKTYMTSSTIRLAGVFAFFALTLM
jgi:hypothetical protein